MYDSINVLYASGIIVRRVQEINCKKEYFFRPEASIGTLWSHPDSKVLADRELVKQKVATKFSNIYHLHQQYTFLDTRLKVLEKLVQRNRKSASLQVKPLDLSKSANVNLNSVMSGDRPLSKTTSRREEIESKSSSNLERAMERVSVPCYFYSMKNKICKIDRSVTSEGRVIVRFRSKDPAFLYQDFEIIKKLL